MSSVQKIRELVNDYISEEVSVAGFANDFTPLLSVALRSQDQPSRELAVAIHTYISHYFHGLIPEQEMRSHLSSLCELKSVYSVTVTMPTLSGKFEVFAVDECGELIPA
jgi:hypothetical protein